MIPPWLRHPDPSLDPDYQRRAMYSYPHIIRWQRDDQPDGTDFDTDLELYEQMAAALLPARRRWTP